MATSPDGSMGPLPIAPNDVVQFPYWEPVDEATATVVTAMSTGPTGFDPTLVEVFSDRGGDPTMCADDEDQTTLDLVYTTAKGMVTDWPAGNYSIQLSTINAIGGNSTDVPAPIIFTVTGKDTDPTVDASAEANHVLPEQCS